MDLFVKRLVQLRLNRKIGRENLADILEISYSSYRRYEAGTREPTLSVLVRMADYFGVTIDYLVGRTDH